MRSDVSTIPMSTVGGGVVEESATTRPEAAGMKIDDGKPQDAPKTSIGALLEVANTIRKEKLNDSVTNISSEDGVVRAVETDDKRVPNNAMESKVGKKSAYSAETVAAISSLAAGESPLFYDAAANGISGEDNNTAGQKSTSSTSKRAALAKKEITLQDRASAVMSVYKDYLDEAKDKDDTTGLNGNSTEMVTDEDELVVPFHTVKHRPLNLHERRKEGHKVAVLDKFCKDVEEGNITANNTQNYFDDSDDEEEGNNSTQEGSHNSKSSKMKRFAANNHPTAASTTAAFRLKAEVALKAAATKTKIVATNAAVAVKTKYKDRTTGPEKLLEKIGRGVENDYDFANYDDDVLGGGGEGARILSKKNNRRTNEEMEYGIPPPSSQNDNIVDSGLYGMHMLQRDDEIKSLKRKGRIDKEEMESMQRFNDICDELGVTPASHSNLHYFYQRQRSQYKYPIFRSKKCKRAMLYGAICLAFLVMVVSLVSAITHGFKDIQQKKKAKPLPDWKEDEEWRDSIKETWEKIHDGSEEMILLTEKQIEYFDPHWFSDPLWSGTTHEDAKRFCEYIKVGNDQAGTRQLCPLEAYCPNGPSHDKPLFGEMDAYEGEQWAPISSDRNQWVMIGKEGMRTCSVNSSVESVDTMPPSVKKHILCCLGSSSDSNVSGEVVNSSPETVDDEIATETQLKQLFEEVSLAYRPILYDRNAGWQGQTYQEAVMWCDAYHNYIPCPYEVYCPDQKHLMAGMQNEDGESWAPVVNQENEWVYVGVGDVCELYSAKFGTKPDWGVSGANSEAITRHIMCCRGHGLQNGEEPDYVVDHYVITATNPPVPPPNDDEESDVDGDVLESDAGDVGDFQGSELDFEKLEVELTQSYNPTWFDRETGWKGQTYDESMEFCNEINGYIPCPHNVYCPGGNKKVLGGRKDQGESWAAVSNGFNEWVQVGAGGECNLYSANEGESPSWGLTGANNEEITRHIMCCQPQPEGEESNVDSDTATVEEEIVTEAEDIDAEETKTEENGSDNVAQNGNNSSSMSMLEIVTQNTYHPEWFDSRLGWLGGTYDDARAFCESLPQPNNGHWYLCPRQAYCPQGPRENEPLYLQKDAFEGIQWAPVSDRQNGWVLVGKMSQALPHTCEEYFEMNHHDPEWGLDGSSKDMKQNILCCNAASGIYLSEDNKVPISGGDPNKPDHGESAFLGTVAPRWFSVTDGWNSGSHEDAFSFCEQHDSVHQNGKKMELCPYVAYCPEGSETKPIGGHGIDINEEGEQWAPIYGKGNLWVSLSGEKTCMSHMEMKETSWEPDVGMKKHVLCCSPKQ